MADEVHIVFKRVQTWLFAVPRLRAMVGANALIGRVLRKELYELALSNLAWQLCSVPRYDEFPESDADDPLEDEDYPGLDALSGIVSRDGGHFEAIFEHGARDFAREAASLLRRQVAGLPFAILINRELADESGAIPDVSLPVFRTCEWSGGGYASAFIRQGSERETVSVDVAYRHAEAQSVASGSSSDLASALARTTDLASLGLGALTFKELASGGYLALIHADGNGVGQGAPERTEDDDADRLELARYYHRNRVLLKRAVSAAIDRAAAAEQVEAEADSPLEKPATQPLVPLMLGGDDLLVVCRAGIALRFVHDLCAELDRIQQAEERPFRLTLGVGVVIARPTIPIHRLHDVAEQLASSAKQRYRSRAGGPGESVIDWAVYSTSWIGDVADDRRAHWLHEGTETRVLSRRPLSVLGDSTDLRSLTGLLACASPLLAPEVPRSQLRRLVEQIQRGRHLADLAFAELSPAARQALRCNGIDKVWEMADGGWATSLLDLIEVAEIPRLGRVKPVAREELVEEALEL